MDPKIIIYEIYTINSRKVTVIGYAICGLYLELVFFYWESRGYDYFYKNIHKDLSNWCIVGSWIEQSRRKTELRCRNHRK